MLKTELDVQIMISNTHPGGATRAFGLAIQARGNGLAQACPAVRPYHRVVANRNLNA